MIGNFGVVFGLSSKLQRVRRPVPARDAAGGSLSANQGDVERLYEFSDGTWRMKPYVGAGFGMIDVNQHVLGAQRK